MLTLKGNLVDPNSDEQPLPLQLLPDVPVTCFVSKLVPQQLIAFSGAGTESQKMTK